MAIPESGSIRQVICNISKVAVVGVSAGAPSSMQFALRYPERISSLVLIVPGTLLPLDPEHIYKRNLEVPAGGGVGCACAMARAYSAFATGGRELGLREETLRALISPAVPPVRGFYDECLKSVWHLSLGFAKPSPELPFGSPGAFGAPGAGGSFGYADPEIGAGYAYVMNRMSFKQGNDPRELAIRQAFHRAIGQHPGSGVSA